MTNANSLDAGRRLQLERLSGPLGRYDGLLILLGIALTVDGMHFLVIEQLPGAHKARGCDLRAELLLSAASALIAAGFSTYLALG